MKEIEVKVRGGRYLVPEGTRVEDIVALDSMKLLVGDTIEVLPDGAIRFRHEEPGISEEDKEFIERFDSRGSNLSNNKYAEKLALTYGSAEMVKVAGDLLEIMRPEMEELLQKYAYSLPTCPSQSLRAIRLLEQLQRDIEWLVTGKDSTIRNNMATFSAINREIRLVKDFLAVHRTVWILEGRCL